MANDKTEGKATVTGAETPKKLILEREKFTSKDGRQMWGYAVHGNVRGRETKVDFVAYDQGGYEVLDMVYDMSSKVELEMHDESMVDGQTGEVRNYTVYSVSGADEDGDVITCRIKPARDSDKSILAYLLKKLNRSTATPAA